MAQAVGSTVMVGDGFLFDEADNVSSSSCISSSIGPQNLGSAPIFFVLISKFVWSVVFMV